MIKLKHGENHVANCHNPFLVFSQIHFLSLKKEEKPKQCRFGWHYFYSFPAYVEARKNKILNHFSRSLSSLALTTHPTQPIPPHILPPRRKKDRGVTPYKRALGRLHISLPTPPCPVPWRDRARWPSLPLPINTERQRREKKGGGEEDFGKDKD